MCKKGTVLMEKMKELYEKVAGDSKLQAKFNAILSEAEKAGEAGTGEKLTAFAKEIGYDVTLEEMQAFFKELAEKGKGQLSEAELDMVAGGKSIGGIFTIIGSVVTIGASCAGIAMASADIESKTNRPESHCRDAYK